MRARLGHRTFEPPFTHEGREVPLDQRLDGTLEELAQFKRAEAPHGTKVDDEVAQRGLGRSLGEAEDPSPEGLGERVEETPSVRVF
jgi:hypothetical protein